MSRIPQNPSTRMIRIEAKLLKNTSLWKKNIHTCPFFITRISKILILHILIAVCKLNPSCIVFVYWLRAWELYMCHELYLTSYCHSTSTVFSYMLSPIDIKYSVFAHTGRLRYILHTDCKETYVSIQNVFGIERWQILSCLYFLFLCICEACNPLNIATWTTSICMYNNMFSSSAK